MNIEAVEKGGRAVNSNLGQTPAALLFAGQRKHYLQPLRGFVAVAAVMGMGDLVWISQVVDGANVFVTNSILERNKRLGAKLFRGFVVFASLRHPYG